LRVFYDRAQITTYRKSPVSDAITEEYVNNLFESAKVLDELL